MNKTLLAFGTLALLTFLLTAPSACFYDNEQDLYGITTCDTTGISFSKYIKPLLDSKCNSCHAPGGVQETTPLVLYDDVKNYADNGLLVKRTNDSNTPMPQSGLLPECDRNKIRAWVNAGARNN